MSRFFIQKYESLLSRYRQPELASNAQPSNLSGRIRQIHQPTASAEVMAVGAQVPQHIGNRPLPIAQLTHPNQFIQLSSESASSQRRESPAFNYREVSSFRLETPAPSNIANTDQKSSPIQGLASEAPPVYSQQHLREEYLIPTKHICSQSDRPNSESTLQHEPTEEKWNHSDLRSGMNSATDKAMVQKNTTLIGSKELRSRRIVLAANGSATLLELLPLTNKQPITQSCSAVWNQDPSRDTPTVVEDRIVRTTSLICTQTKVVDANNLAPPTSAERCSSNQRLGVSKSQLTNLQSRLQSSGVKSSKFDHVQPNPTTPQQLLADEASMPSRRRTAEFDKEPDTLQLRLANLQPKLTERPVEHRRPSQASLRIPIFGKGPQAKKPKIFASKRPHSTLEYRMFPGMDTCAFDYLKLPPRDQASVPFDQTYSLEKVSSSVLRCWRTISGRD